MDPTDVGINSSNSDTNKMVHTNKKIYFSSLPLPLALTIYMYACLFSPHSKQHVYFPNLYPSFLLGITTTFPYNSHSQLPKCTCCTDQFWMHSWLTQWLFHLVSSLGILEMQQLAFRDKTDSAKIIIETCSTSFQEKLTNLERRN